MEDYNYLVPKWVYDFQTLLAVLASIVGYFIKLKLDDRRNRKGLAAALLAEITELLNYYEQVRLKPWEVTDYINIQSLEEEYMTVYNNLGDKIALFSVEDAKEIVGYYTCLKAHLDTLRVLVKMQALYDYLDAGVKIFGDMGNSSLVVKQQFNEYYNTHRYALNSQELLFERSKHIVETLNKHLDKSIPIRLYINLKTMISKFKIIEISKNIFRKI